MAPSDKAAEEAADAEMKDAQEATEGKDDEQAEDAKGEQAEDAKDGEQAEDGKDGEQAEEGKDGEADGTKDEQKEAKEEEEAAEEPEQPKELEEDAPEDGRPAIRAAVAVSASDSTLNVTPSCGGKVLMALSDGGFQYLLAGARANAGVKAGRYLYEVRIVESRNPLDPTAKQQGQRTPRQVCFLGFSVAGSSLFLGDSEDSVGFDSEGNFLSGKSRTRISSRFMPYTQVFGILLNLDPKSPNANTVSLFRDGTRICKPKPIPESLKGKVLYPTVNYKNMTLHINFGPAVMAPLPFKCLTLQEAAVEDVDVAVPRAPADGRCEVLFPVGLPDEGTFDWLDAFLKRNPDYTELSSRAILEWGIKSGLWRQRGSSRNCNDRPIMEFGIRELDDDTVRKMIQTVAPLLKRNYVVMEVRDNLLPGGRQQLLSQFDSADFRKVALVVIGEPPEEHKAVVRRLVLQDKRQRAGAEVRRRRAQEAPRPQRAPPPPPRPEGAAVEAGAGAEDKTKAGEQEKDGEKEPEESLEEAVKKAEEAVELTEEEKGLWFRKPMVEDLTKKELGQYFNSFTLPSQDEGFDEVKYDWQPESACKDYMKVWVSEHKLTQRVEDLQPGQWFRDQLAEWSRLLQEWRRKHGEWRDPNRRWQVEKRKREEKERKAEQEEGTEEPKEAEEKPAEAGDGDVEAAAEDGDEKKAEGEAEDGKKEDAQAKEEDSKMEEDIKAEDIDVFAVQDVCDVGNGEPLFANFTWEDWMLLSLRFELHLLAHAYGHDMNDPERTSFHETHLGFYYNKYYKKQFNLKYYGVSTELELLQIIKDTIEVTPKNSILDPQLADDTPMENFLKLTEDHRRERARRIDAGDETAMLNFQKPPPRGQQGHYQQQSNRGSYQSRGPPPAQHGRGGPPSSRTGPPSGGAPSRYGSAGGGGARGGAAAYSGGGGGYGSRGGGPPAGGRYAAPTPAPPPSRGGGGYGGHAPAQSSYGGGGQKRSYPPPSSSNYPPYKQARSGGSYGSGAPSSRGSYSGGSYGSGGGGSYGGGYRR